MAFRGTVTLSPNVVTGWLPGSHMFEPYNAGMVYGWSKISAPSAERAEDGLYRLKVTIVGPRLFLSDLFSFCLSRHLEVYSSNGLNVWEGLVYDATLHMDNVDLKLSMDRIANGVYMKYRVVGSGTTVRSTEKIDTASRAQYGIIQHVLGGAELVNSAVADYKCNQYLELNRQPKPTKIGDGSDPSLELFGYGYMTTLDWQIYNQTALTGDQPASSQVRDIVTAKGQFVKSMKIGGNTMPITKVYDVDRTAYNIIRDIARLGDTLQNRWLIRMLQDRLFVFDQAAPSRTVA